MTFLDSMRIENTPKQTVTKNIFQNNVFLIRTVRLYIHHIHMLFNSLTLIGALQ